MRAIDPIIVVGSARLKTGEEERVREILLGFVEPSRREEGCLGYELLEGVHHTGIFYTFEKWVSEEDLNRHVLGHQAELNELASLLSENASITVVKPLG